MIELTLYYQGPSDIEGGYKTMRSFYKDLRAYIGKNFEREVAVEKKKIEGIGPGSRSLLITFPNSEITHQSIRLHDDVDETRLKEDLVEVYNRNSFVQFP